MFTQEIKSSLDYESFKFLDFNRDLSRSNIDKLKKLNVKEAQFHLFPIVVNGEMEIIDGQHRYVAAKELECPIFYIESDIEKVEPLDIYKVNVAGKKHSLGDKLLIMGRSGNKEVLRAMEMQNSFPEHSLEVVAQLCHQFSTGGQVAKSLDNNTYGCKYYAKTFEFLNRIRASSLELKGVREVFSMATIVTKSEAKNIKMEKVFERMEKNRALIERLPSRELQRRNYIAVYNRGLLEENRIH